jgi:hypothetical protein
MCRRAAFRRIGVMVGRDRSSEGRICEPGVRYFSMMCPVKVRENWDSFRKRLTTFMNNTFAALSRFIVCFGFVMPYIRGKQYGFL